MQLTQRQQDFLRNLLDLYHTAQQPVHYSQVAQALGVNRFSAYDMLKLLEQRGYLTSHYVLAPAHSGPGRSSIAFLPTAKARAAMRLFGWKSGPSEEWQAVRERVLKQLRERGPDDALLRELLTHIPDIKSPVEYCAETAAALIVNLHAIKQKAADLNPLKAVPALAPTGHLGLGTLAGLSIGSAIANGLDRSVLDRLLALTKLFQAHISTLSEEHLRNLSELVDDAMELIGQTSISSARERT
jgi:hypothetical protein